jgi:hypothetical protein
VSNESVPSGEVDFIRSANAGMPRDLVPVDFTET